MYQTVRQVHPLSGQTYDGDGNPTTYQGYGFAYDAEDRITGIGGVLTAGYTGDGLRAWKGDASGANRTFFLYGGDKVVCEETASGALINRRRSCSATAGRKSA